MEAARLSGEDPIDLAPLERALGYEFRDRTLLEQALAHSSWAHERTDATSNERLEFLGDSVIGMVVAHLLYEAHPAWAEGDLSRGLSRLVDRTRLARLGRELDVGAWLRVGRAAEQAEGAANETILSDATEAVIGAMYLDGGLEPVEQLARRVFGEALEEGTPPVDRDPKSALNEWSMARFEVFPSYTTVVDTGIDGDELRFTVEVGLAGEIWGRGTARSKRLAERAAAQVAIDERFADETGEKEQGRHG